MLKKIFYKIYFSIPHRIRSREFYKFKKILEKNSDISKEKVIEYQINKFKEILNIAYYYTDFYRQKYDEVGFHPSMFKTMEDLKKIPILERYELRDNLERMKNKNFNGKLRKSFTSGSTGTPTLIYTSSKGIQRELASLSHQFDRIGFDYINSARIEIRGKVENDHLYDYIKEQKILRINILKINQNTIHKIIEKIKSVGYENIYGYPSAIFIFSELILKNKISLNIKKIIFASEILYDWQLEYIENVFPDAAKFCFYGMAERVCLAGWMKDDRKYYFLPSYGITEFDDKNCIIGTSLINDVVPLIRYKTTDIAGEKIETKGSYFPVIKNIQGRLEDIVYDIKGNKIPPSSLTFIFKNLGNYINKTKLIQNSFKEWSVYFETKYKNEKDKEIELIIDSMKKMFGKEIIVKVIFSEELSSENNGKFKWVEQKIKRL
ncbi:MAG: hypothetical protein C0601_02605 [Candidatus Muiribacterium halophilum]|uniref:CoF synthetase n=1 Tax=Muiribacterium halophilum TaxID=2053465 RepID=A0A2N5ZKF1_MUIH1|nr:MAG: hypothetical protein C0601_02605 [Candidatus Muirbacterium halophilum]